MNLHFLKRNHGSITTRLVLLLTIGTTLLWCAAVGYATYTSYQELNEAFDVALRETAYRLLPLAEDDYLGREGDDSRAIQRLMRESRSYISYQLRNASGEILLRARNAPSVPYDPNPAPGFATVGDFRLFSETDPANGLTVTVAETMHNRLEAVLGSVKALLWPLLALIPMNILAIWFGVRSAMAPVRILSADIAARGSENLAPIDVSDQPRELKPIADAVARLVERLRVALDAERAFSANSAHELRTPIAGALAQTQRLIAELENSAHRKRARDVEGTLKRLSRLSEKLLQLSRVDAGISLRDEVVDLLPVLDLVVADASARLPGGRRISYVKGKDAELVARMDADAFAMAVRNLLDNAAIHGTGAIEVRLEPQGVVRVANDGPVVPPEVLARLTQRFARGRTAVAGSGLGLAIVETIMEQSGGRLRLVSPATGRENGFEARLELDAVEGDAARAAVRPGAVVYKSPEVQA